MSWLKSNPLERSLWCTAMHAFLDVEDNVEYITNITRRNSTRYDHQIRIIENLRQRVSYEIEWDDFVCPPGKSPYQHWLEDEDGSSLIHGPMPGGNTSRLMTSYILLWYQACDAMPTGNETMGYEMARSIVESDEKMDDAPLGMAQWSERTMIWFLMMRLQGWNMTHRYNTPGYRQSVRDIMAIATRAGLLPIDPPEEWLGECSDDPHAWGTDIAPTALRLLFELEWFADGWRKYHGPMRLIIEWAQMLQARVALCLFQHKDRVVKNKTAEQELLLRSAEVFVPMWGETVGIWTHDEFPWDVMHPLKSTDVSVENPCDVAWNRAPSPLTEDFTHWMGWEIPRLGELVELLWNRLIFPDVITALHGKFKDSVSFNLETTPMPLGIIGKMSRWRNIRPTPKTALAHWAPLSLCEFMQIEAFSRPIHEVFEYCLKSETGGAVGACDEDYAMDAEMETMLQHILPHLVGKLMRVGDFAATQWILDPSPEKMCALWRTAMTKPCLFVVAIAGQYHIWCTLESSRENPHPIIFCGGIVRACLTWLHLVLGNAFMQNYAPFTGLPISQDISTQPLLLECERVLESGVPST